MIRSSSGSKRRLRVCCSSSTIAAASTRLIAENSMTVLSPRSRSPLHYGCQSAAVRSCRDQKRGGFGHAVAFLLLALLPIAKSVLLARHIVYIALNAGQVLA